MNKKSSKELKYPSLEIYMKKKSLFDDDDTCATSVTSLASSTATPTEEEYNSKESTDISFLTTVPLEEEDSNHKRIISSKESAEVSLLQQRIESLEHYNKELGRDLSMREHKVNSLASWCESQEKTIIRLKERGDEINSLRTRCAAQEEIIIGLRDTEITKEEIEQLCDAIKNKDVKIKNLNEELKRKRQESLGALKEKERIEIMNCSETNTLKKTIHDVTRKVDMLHLDVVKLNSDVTSKDEEIKYKQSAIMSMTKLRIDQVQKLHSLHLQVLSINKTKKDYSNKVAALQIEIDQMKSNAVNEAIVLQENVAKLDELKIITAKKDETIEQQKEKLAKSMKLNLQVSSINKTKKDYSNKIAALQLEIDQMMSKAENEAIIHQENIAKLDQLEIITAKKDETIEQQKEKLAKSITVPPFVDDGAFWDLEDELKLTQILAIEHQDDLSWHEDEELFLYSADNELHEIDERKIYFGGEDEDTFLNNIAELDNTMNEFMDTIEEGKGCFTSIQNRLVQTTHISNEISQQKNKLEDDLKQSRQVVSKLQEGSQSSMEGLIINAILGNQITNSNNDNIQQKNKLEDDIKQSHEVVSKRQEGFQTSMEGLIVNAILGNQSTDSKNDTSRQKNKLEDDLKQSHEGMSKRQEGSQTSMEALIVNAILRK